MIKIKIMRKSNFKMNCKQLSMMITNKKIKRIGIKMSKRIKIRIKNKKEERNKMIMILIMMMKKILKIIRKTKKIKKI